MQRKLNLKTLNKFIPQQTRSSAKYSRRDSIKSIDHFKPCLTYTYVCDMHDVAEKKNNHMYLCDMHDRYLLLKKINYMNVICMMLLKKSIICTYVICMMLLNKSTIGTDNTPRVPTQYSHK